MKFVNRWLFTLISAIWIQSAYPIVISQVGSCDTPGFARDVYVIGSYAYVADQSSLQVINISDPAHPTIIGSCNTPGASTENGLYVSGGYAYMADGASGLQVINISDPAHPSIAGSCDTPGGAHDVYVSGSYAYVADGYSGLKVINISDPAHPTIAGSCATPAGVNTLGVYVSGSYAYMADNYGVLQVVNISDPAHPTIAGSYDTLGYSFDIYVSGNYAYMANWDAGLKVIDISNPAHPTLAGSCDTSGYAHAVYVSGNYVFVADFDGGLQVIDISDPTHPTLAGSNTQSGSWGVYVSGSYAYMADSSAGLIICFISGVGPVGTLQLSASTVNVNENAGSITLYVTRSGGSSGAARVNYTTQNGTAFAGTDYTTKSGQLNWADGNSDSKPIRVQILDNSVADGDKYFTVQLSSAFGASLGTPSSETVTIVDNESSVFTLTPNSSGRVLSGSVNNQAAPFSLRFDFSSVGGVSGANSYYIIFEADDSTFAPDTAAPYFTLLPNAWRIEVPSGQVALTVGEDRMAKWITLLGPPSIWGNAASWPLTSWPAAKYTWKVWQTGESWYLASGEFRMARLVYRGGTGTTPLVLVHGFAGSETMWAHNGVDYVSDQGVCGYFRARRPTYTLDYPNVGDIRESCELLDMALSRAAGAHGASRADVVAHSMGGVMTRYYKKNRIESGATSYLRDFVSLGSPFEGTAFAADASGLTGVIPMILNLVHAGTLVEKIGFLKAAGGIGSTAAAQLVNPSSTQGAGLSLWNNENANVAGDNQFMAICGRFPFLGVGQSAVQALLSYAVKDIAGAVRKYFDVLVYQTGSDGLTTWHSGCKEPIPEPKNLYLLCSHIGYTAPMLNSQQLVMQNNIETFLTDGSPNYTAAPPIVDMEYIQAILVCGGQAVANGFLFVYDPTGLIREVYSNLSDAFGRMIMRRLGDGGSLASLTSADSICAWAPGYGITPVTAQNIRLIKSATSAADIYVIELQPNTSYTAPRNGKVTINDDALTTESSSVALSISANNATELAVSEFGCTNAVSWESYKTSRSYAFANTSAGEKILIVAFRNSSATGACATDKIILVNPSEVGNIHVSDNRTNATIVLNSQVLTNTTPSTLVGLAPGSYRVSLIKNGIVYTPSSSNVTVTAGQTVSVLFSESMGTHPVNDYDGDGKSDLAVFHDGSFDQGSWYSQCYWSIYSLASGILLNNADGFWNWPHGSGWTPAPGDYDGDGKSDLAMYRDGYWSIWSQDDLVNCMCAGGFGAPDWIPVPGDYDGDGKADLAVFHDGYWSIYLMAGSVLLNNTSPGWPSLGEPGWIPVPGDYNGDGKADLAVYRDGYWSIDAWSRGFFGGIAFYSVGYGGWGAPGWTPVPGDYDGDGKSDLAVYRDGYWYIYMMAGSVLEGGWGAPGWIPLSGDYDSDGKSDLAVYRDGYWYIYMMAGSVLEGGFGAPGWTPVH